MMIKIKNTEEFIQAAIEKHKDRYSYSSADYAGASRKVIVTCPIHGDFQQVARAHLKGAGCKKCSNGLKAAATRLSNAAYIDKVQAVHGDRYDLSHISYTTSISKIEVHCKLHGAFFPRAGNFLYRATNCPACKHEETSSRSRLNLSTYLARFLSVHGDRYTYTGITYKDQKAYIQVVCKTHGSFSLLAQDHLRGIGCSKCSRPVHNHETFLKAAAIAHGDRYDYSLSKYIRALSKVVITCKEHGPFEQTPSSHVSAGQGCPYCASTGPSKGQREIYEFIKALHPDTIMEHPLAGKSRVDIFVPALNIGIEYHGLIWHSTRFHVDPLNLIHKHKKAAAEGIRLIHIFQDEWESRNSAVRNMLLAAVNKGERTFARECEVRPITEQEALDFSESAHLQGGVRSATHYGLWTKEAPSNLVAVMSFSGTTSNRTRARDSSVWELRRYCSIGTVVGGASKLFKYFIKVHSPSEVVSYSDTRVFQGAVYSALGFKQDAVSRPSYYYITPGVVKRYNKSRFQLKYLSKLFGSKFDPALTEADNCAKNNWYQLYDCGKVRWVWAKE